MSDAHARHSEAVSTIQTAKLPSGSHPEEFGPRQSAGAGTTGPSGEVRATSNESEGSTGPDMRQLDETMAVEADQLLQGGFESVEEVLASESNDAGGHAASRSDTGFLDSQSASVELIPDRDDMVGTETVTGEQGTPRQEKDDEPTAHEPAQAPEQVESVEGDDADVPDAEESDAGAAVDKVNNAPEPEEENITEAGVEDGPAEKAASADEGIDEQDAGSGERDDSLAGNSLGQDDLGADETSDDESAMRGAEIAEPHKADRVHSVIQKGLFAVAIVLALLSLPLRFVPDSLRPFVDWFALSLIFWVPIVWVIALVLA